MSETAIPVTNKSFYDAFQEVNKEEVQLNSDDKILVTAETEGWKLIKDYINAVIDELEEQSSIQVGESLEVWGARRMAIDTAKKQLKRIIDHVESIAKYVKENRKPE